MVTNTVCARRLWGMSQSGPKIVDSTPYPRPPTVFIQIKARRPREKVRNVGTLRVIDCDEPERVLATIRRALRLSFAGS